MTSPFVLYLCAPFACFKSCSKKALFFLFLHCNHWRKEALVWVSSMKWKSSLKTLPHLCSGSWKPNGKPLNEAVIRCNWLFSFRSSGLDSRYSIQPIYELCVWFEFDAWLFVWSSFAEGYMISVLVSSCEIFWAINLKTIKMNLPFHSPVVCLIDLSRYFASSCTWYSKEALCWELKLWMTSSFYCQCVSGSFNWIFKKFIKYREIIM